MEYPFRILSYFIQNRNYTEQAQNLRSGVKCRGVLCPYVTPPLLKHDFICHTAVFTNIRKSSTVFFNSHNTLITHIKVNRLLSSFKFLVNVGTVYDIGCRGSYGSIGFSKVNTSFKCRNLCTEISYL